MQQLETCSGKLREVYAKVINQLSVGVGIRNENSPLKPIVSYLGAKMEQAIVLAQSKQIAAAQASGELETVREQLTPAVAQASETVKKKLEEAAEQITSGQVETAGQLMSKQGEILKSMWDTLATIRIQEAAIKAAQNELNPPQQEVLPAQTAATATVAQAVEAAAAVPASAEEAAAAAAAAPTAENDIIPELPAPTLPPASVPVLPTPFDNYFKSPAPTLPPALAEGENLSDEGEPPLFVPERENSL
jgi:hypothetical protein